MPAALRPQADLVKFFQFGLERIGAFAANLPVAEFLLDFGSNRSARIDDRVYLFCILMF